VIKIVPADESHIACLARDMRAMDCMECRAVGREPEEALKKVMETSLWCITALDDDKPIAMLGVVARNMIEAKGIPWMLGSEKIYESTRDIVTLAPHIVRMMRETFSSLENLVSVDNHRAISFLRHYGWKLTDERHMIGGVEFAKFTDERNFEIV